MLAGFGGFLGTIARFLSHQAIAKYYPVIFPIGTLTINLIGCLLIGVFHGLIEKYQVPAPEWRLFFTAGFCGGFTTFSAFGLESMLLIQHREYLYLIIYIVLSVLLGLAATGLGMWMVKIFHP